MVQSTIKISPSSWPIGSIWRRWDLHVHTPLSMLGSSFTGIAWNEYVDALEKAAEKEGIAVIGVTDYMTIDGYEKLHQEKTQNDRLKSTSLLIPNIEFRILPATSDGKALNLHLLIDPEAPDHIQRIKDALRNLRIEYDGHTYGCFHDDLIKFGRAQNPLLGDDAAYKFGLEQFKPDKTLMKSWLEKEKWLRSHSLIGVANGKDGISGLPLDGFGATRDEILKLCDFVFSGNPSDRRHYLGQKASAPPEEIVRQYRSLKPCLHGSDAHKIEDLFKPDHDRFCWIKGDPSFHGLRQVLWEPEHRVHIGELPPQHSDKSQVISRINISGDENWFSVRHLDLNPALITVIGEKGSGKTAIADMIAFASGAPLDKSSQSSFINKGAIHLEGVKVELDWANGEKTEAILPAKPFIAGRPKVRYLSQDFVERLCSADHQGIELQSAIEEVVFAKLSEVQREGYSSFGELRNARESASKSRRSRIRGDLAALHKDVESNVISVQERPQKEVLRKEAEQKVRELEKQLPNASMTVDSKVLAELDVAREERKKLEGFVADLRRNKRRVEDALESYQELKEQTHEAVKAIAKRLAPLDLLDNLEVRMQPSWNDDVVEKLKNASGSLGQQIDQKLGEGKIPPPDGSLAHLQTAIKSLEERLAKDEVAKNRVLDLQKEISSAKANAERLKKEVDRIDGSVTESLKRLKNRQFSLYLEMFQALGHDEEGLAELYSPLQAAIDSLGEEMQFRVSVGYQIDKEKWWSKFDGFFDNRKGGVEKQRADTSRIVEKFLLPAWKSGDVALIQSSLEKLLICLEVDTFPKKYGLSSLSLVDLYDWIFSTDHISLSYKIQYGGTDLEHLSPGTRGIALLVLYLLMDEDDTRPLLIDQPEGNLDNSSVFEQLVPYIQQAKKRRQVILITHNPNLVVATDAEQVVVASADRPATQPYPLIHYSSGALEHSDLGDSMGIREAVCLFLEGGKDAFRVRENRYALAKRQATADGA
ncbi:MAG: hypothetical protein R3273_07730 [Pseudidiomarina maritima]|nr:hypothetical protein [Pseudidiomarina maritima]